MKKGYWGVTIMKKKLVSIVITALMLSFTACGTNSKETAESVSQESIETEVSVQNEVQDVKEPTETSQDEDKKVSEESTKDSKSETVSKDEVKTTSKEETTDKNKDSDKPEASAEPTPEPTKEPVESAPAPVQSQTFNVNIKYAGGQVWAHNPDDITNINLVTMPPVDFGNFQLTLNGDIHVASELDGWAEYNTMTEYDGALPSYEFYILVPLDAQDANKTFDFELICPDNTAYNIRTATVRNSIDECAQYINFTYNNGTIKGTVTAKGQNIWICFNVKF